MPQIANIQQMTPVNATNVLNAILGQILSSQSVDAQAAQDLIDATHHYDGTVVRYAFFVIKELPDKQPLASVLLKHASNHNQPILAECAYKAMCGAKDLSPFYRVIKKGILCPDYKIASAALYPISIQAQSRQSIDGPLQQPLIDATDHREDLVVCEALDIIRNFPDKQPYVAALVKHASDHSQPERTASALRAICGANDFSPFYQVIEQAALSTDSLIALDSIAAVYEQADAYKAIDPEFQQAVMNIMHHDDYPVVDYGLEVINSLHDKSPFVSSLQNFPNNPARSQWIQQALEERVADLLNDAGIAQSAVNKASASFHMGVRLDFNIEANGGGSALHPNDAMRALCDVFDQSVTGGIVAVKAKVFCAPVGAPDQNEIIDVTFPEGDKEDILRLSAWGVSPKFDLQTTDGATYIATLKERPSP